MTLRPEITLDDAYSRYKEEGLDDDAIAKRFADRGIDVSSDLGKNPGSMKIHMTVGEFVDSGMAAKATGAQLRSNLFQRGILNASNLTDEDFERPLPASKKNLTYAESRFLNDLEADREAGRYKSWKWDGTSNAAKLGSMVSQQVGSSGDKDSYLRVQEHIRRRSDWHNYHNSISGSIAESFLPGRDDEHRVQPPEPVPGLTEEEYELGEKHLKIRRKIDHTIGWSRATGGVMSALFMGSDLMGVEPGTKTGKALASLFTGANNWKAEGVGIDEAKLLKDTPAGSALLSAVEEKARRNIEELADVTDNDSLRDLSDGEMSERELIAAFGKKRGEKYTKGYLVTHGVYQKKMADQVRYYLRLRNRMKTEKNFTSFSEWMNTALPDSLKIDNHNSARLARRELNASFRQQAKTLEGKVRPLTERAVKEVYEISQGLYTLAAFAFDPTKSERFTGVEDLVASGKMTEDEATDFVRTAAFQEGANITGGIAAYMMPYTLDDTDSLEDQVYAEPIQHALGALAPLSILKAMRVAGAAKSLKRMQKTLRESGYPDELILQATEVGQGLATNAQKGMLRKWLDTGRGKQASTPLLDTLDKYAVPEIITGAAKGATVGYLFGAAPDMVFLGGAGAGLGAIKGVVRGGAARRALGDLAAQQSPHGELVTQEILATLEEMQGVEAAVRFAAEVDLASGDTAALVARAIDAVRDVEESGNGSHLGQVLKPVLDEYKQALDRAHAADAPASHFKELKVRLAAHLKVALANAEARGSMPMLSGVIDTGSSLDALARQRAAVDADPAVLQARAEYAAVVDSLDVTGPASGGASETKRVARENIINAKADALVRFVEGSEEQGGVSYIKSGNKFSESTDGIVKDRLERKEQFQLDIEEIEAGKEEKIRQLTEAKTLEGQRKHVGNLQERIKKQQEAAARTEKKVKEKEAKVQARYDEDVEKLNSDIRSRQQKKSKGKDRTREDELAHQKSEFDKVADTYNDAKRVVDELNEAVVNAKKGTKKDRAKTLAAAKKKLAAAQKKLEKADAAVDKALAEFNDPFVRRGKRLVSFADAMRLIEKRRAKANSAIDTTRARVAKYESASESLLSSIHDIENAVATLLEADTLKFPEGPGSYKKQGGDYVKPDGSGDAFLRDILPEKRRKQAVSQEDRRIERIRLKDAADEKRVRERLDRITRFRAAEYRRALDTAHGLRMSDGDYVSRLDTVNVYDETAGRFRSLDPGDLPDSEYVTMPNGRTGVMRNFDLSIGNMLTRMATFPGEDVTELIRLIDEFADTSVADVLGTAKSGWARAVQKATAEDKPKKGTKSGIEDVISTVRDDLKKQARSKAALDEGWIGEATKALMEGRMTDRGLNDLKRIVLESYGDMIINAGTSRMLSDLKLRKRFVRFASDALEAIILGRDASKQVRNEFRADVGDMSMDFSQGRTIDEWSTFARVDHSFLDPEGNPYTFVSSNGVEIPATIENLFKEFVAGEISPSDIYRARHQSFMDAVYLTARAAESRMVGRKAFLDSTGVSMEVWARGASDPLYQQAVFRYYLETGELPPALRVTQKPGTTDLVLDPLASEQAAAILNAMIPDSEMNKLGLSADAASHGISQAMRTARQRSKGDNARDYVRLGGDLDESRIPGVTRIGSKPVLDPGPGIVSKHDIIQPEHTTNVLSEATKYSDIVIRREFADSIGWMLETHSKLAADKASLGYLSGLNALWKWGKTAGSLVNPMTNFFSNTKTLMKNQGLNPVSAYTAPIKTTFLWLKYRKGELRGTALGDRFDALMRTGFSDQSQLVAEIDKVLQNLYSNNKDAPFVQPLDDLLRGGQVGDRRIHGIREITELQDKLYRRFGDELFKLTDALMEMEKIERRIDLGGTGQALHIRNLDTGGGFSDGQILGSVMKTDDGYAVVIKHGKDAGKVIRVDSLSSPAAARLIARGAMGHANSLYYNLSKTGTVIKRAKHFEGLFIQPFLSWRAKALDIPMVKKGMFYRMFIDDNYLVSDSPLVNLEIYAELAQRQARRAFWLAAVKDHTGDTQAIRQFLPRWARRAIISGTGAEREFFLAESSNPIGGFVSFLEFLNETNRFISGDGGEKTFWDRVNNERTGNLQTMTSTIQEFFGEGAAVQILYALGGWDGLRDKPFETGGEHIGAVIKSIAPGWMSRPFTVANRVIEESQQKLDYDIEKLGKKSNHSLLKHGDTFVSVSLSLISRKYRRIDPIWLAKLASNIPGRLVKEIVRVAKDGAKKGLDNESDEVQEKIKLLRNAMEAYKDHVPRMVKALKKNGFSPKELEQLEKYSKKKIKESDEAYARWQRLP